MRKTVVLLLAFVLCFVGCAVDPASYRFDADEIIEKATKIELVECKNNNPTEVIVDSNTVLKFDFANAKVIDVLEESKIKDFANELASIRFHLENESVDSPIGYAVLIHMEGEEIIVLSATVVEDVGCYSMAASFTSEGDFIRHIARFADEPSYRKLLEKYFCI